MGCKPAPLSLFFVLRRLLDAQSHVMVHSMVLYPPLTVPTLPAGKLEAAFAEACSRGAHVVWHATCSMLQHLRTQEFRPCLLSFSAQASQGRIESFFKPAPNQPPKPAAKPGEASEPGTQAITVRPACGMCMMCREDYIQAGTSGCLIVLTWSQGAPHAWFCHEVGVEGSKRKPEPPKKGPAAKKGKLGGVGGGKKK
eukprot:1158388-Pelagomonas_calceolata.AAC.1